MLFRRFSLFANLMILAAIVGAPFALLWGWLLLSGRIDVRILTVAMAMLVIDGALIAWSLWRLLAPIQSIGNTLDEVSKGNFAIQVDNPYCHGVGHTIDNINAAIDKTGETMRNLLYQAMHVATTGFGCMVSGQKIAMRDGDADHRHTPLGQTEHLMRNLKQLSQVITIMIKELDHYEIPHKPLLLAQAEHIQWCQQLMEMLVASSDLRPEEVVDHNHCRFGRWYLRGGMENYGNLKEFQALAEPHRRFHDMARRVASLHQAGRRQEATEAFDQLVKHTYTMIALLDSLYQEASIPTVDHSAHPQKQLWEPTLPVKDRTTSRVSQRQQATGHGEQVSLSGP